MANKPSDNWYVRASSMGALMTGGRGKDNPWGATALTTIQDAVLRNKYGLENKVYSKYMDKGIMNEPQALQMLIKKMGWTNIDLGKSRLFNDYVTGEPDLHHDFILADVKCSFSASTFPWLDTELKNKDYIYQMQTYMWLSGIKTSYLAYCLTDAPESMIMEEVQRRVYKEMSYPDNKSKSMDEVESEVYISVKKEMTYPGVIAEKRCKVFEVEYDEEIVEKIRLRVVEAREKYDQIYNII
tara:strand:+ start:2505 stop:3227 length:723 start_codon:yes stop_codon:yes gene_type:complete